MQNPRGYQRHFVACNRHDLSLFAPFYIAGKRYGFIDKDLTAFLLERTAMFMPQSNRGGDGIALAPHFDSYASRSEALLLVTKLIAAQCKKPLRNETYAVVENWQDQPIAEVDRAAIPWLGLRAWGVHVNGFVRKPDGIYLWVGERSADRPAEPGKLDNMIGGGQPLGLSVEENLCKEAKEEAGIEAELAMTAKPIRTIDYRIAYTQGLRTDTLFIYDLELPESFTPQNTDGEVAAFHLMPLAEVAALVRDTDKFKFNCNLVVIDFLMRHGFITAQDAEYDALRRWLG